ncbi:hypothetical protein B0H21DRAFT_851969 [Amylocystis lapponica]|nr:hypothetical protein B0H21DRAFT_851969 [Amylocystis lapponica]
MDVKFVPRDPEDFLKSFIEAPTDKTEPCWDGVFDSVLGGVKEKDISHAMLKCIKISDVCPGYKVLNTSNKADKHDESGQNVDGGLYLNAEKPKGKRNYWFHQRVSFGWKRSDTKDDPFDDTPGCAFEAPSELRKKNRGQIISYASEVLMRQHRCFHFTVVIFDLYTRIIRWDRSGAIVTRRFNYKDDPRVLCSFLWRFCHLSDDKQGYDPTAVFVERGTPDFAAMVRASKKKLKTRRRVTKSARWKERTRSMTSEEQKAELERVMLDIKREDYARQCFAESLRGGWPCWKVSVDDSCDDSEDSSVEDTSSPPAERSTRWFLVCKPYFMAQGPIGRGTRGYIALDCVTRTFMFLKDAWRVDADGFEKEGAVLKALNNAEVRNIPTVICHGDVQNQHTITHEYWSDPDPDAQNPMKGHAHYRLVEEEVGCSLSRFDTGQFLLKIAVDFLEEFRGKNTYTHGDIERLELSKCIRPDPRLDIDQQLKARQPDRTGTWQFLSAFSLNDAFKPMCLQDDLESFFHVLLYEAIRFLPSNSPNVAAFMTRYFDDAICDDGKYSCGPAKSEAMNFGHIYILVDGLGKDLQFHFFSRRDRAQVPHPLDEVIEELLSWFGAFYRHTKHLKKSPRHLTNSERTDPQFANIDPFLSNAPVPVPDRSIRRAKLAITPETDADTAALLDSHQPMARFMTDMCRQHNVWPSDDKVPDRLTSNFKGGLKRISEEDDDPRPSKRTRTSHPATEVDTVDASLAHSPKDSVQEC